MNRPVNSLDTKRKIPLDTTWRFSAKVPKTQNLYTVPWNPKLRRLPQTPRQSSIWPKMVISGSLPVKIPIKILFPENFIAPKVAPENFRGVLGGIFEIQWCLVLEKLILEVLGGKTPSRIATVNRRWTIRDKFNARVTLRIAHGGWNSSSLKGQWSDPANANLYSNHMDLPAEY